LLTAVEGCDRNRRRCRRPRASLSIPPGDDLPGPLQQRHQHLKGLLL
jgi:hypothetical protein